MTNFAFRSAAVLAAVFVGAAANCAPQAAATPVLTSPSLPAAPVPGMVRYADPVNGWSISYPGGWLLNAADPALVQIRDPENQALVSIRVTSTDLPLNAVADQILASQEQFLLEKGLTWVRTARQLIALPNGTAAVDVRGDILPDGKSHQLYIVRRGKAFAINAETNATLWDKFSGDFDRILQSFAAPT
jgi:hypothetical protein